MAFAELRIFSESLGISTEVNVIIPQRSILGEIGTEHKAQKGQYPCLYLLHGLSDDQTIWARRTSIERYASQYGIAVVMPRAEKSFYTDMKHGDKYYTYIADELPRIMCDLFPISTKREDNLIAGNSMGGYGALKIALRNPERFRSGIALSPVADILGFYDRAPETLSRVFGEKSEVERFDNLFDLASDTALNENKPSLYIAVGYDDFMYTDIVKFQKHLDQLGYDLTYCEASGGHNWDFWDKYICCALKWAYANDTLK